MLRNKRLETKLILALMTASFACISRAIDAQSSSVLHRTDVEVPRLNSREDPQQQPAIPDFLWNA